MKKIIFILLVVLFVAPPVFAQPHTGGGPRNILPPQQIADSLKFPQADGHNGVSWQTISQNVFNDTGALHNWEEGLSTDAPNDDIPIVSLSTIGDSDDIGIALQGKGKYNFQLSIPDGTAFGGNPRGYGAVDLQIAITGFGHDRSSATEVASGAWSSIGGGSQNTASGIHSWIGGGYDNSDSAQFGSIGGGNENQGFAPSSTLGGGESNIIHAQAQFGTIGGGDLNLVDSIGGAIAGGKQNTVQGKYGFVGGGSGNQVTKDYSVIPGGISCALSGKNSLAFSNATASYTGDSSAFFQVKNFDLANSNKGTTKLRFFSNTGGTYPGAIKYIGFQAPASLAASLNFIFPDADGDPGMVLTTDGSGTLSFSAVDASLASLDGLGDATAVLATPGYLYSDGIMYAWGDVNADSTFNVDNGYGASTITHPSTGVYLVRTPFQYTHMICAVTARSGATLSFATVSESVISSATVFTVRTWSALGVLTDEPFYFQIFGRP